MTPFIRALVAVSSLAGAAAAAEPPVVSEAWIRATPPGARTAAAYLTIASTAAADRLVGAATPAAASVEIHAQATEGDLPRMVRLADLDVPGGEAVRLEPGGRHLMLLDLTMPLAAGTKVPLSLRFATAGTVELEVPVIDARQSAPAQHGAH